jgi:2-oxoglutarate ferredoxin oxidoreductase subunit gamma
MIREEKIIVAGFGGQGVMMIGQLLAYAGNEKNYNSLWVPSYGPETRGGTANCSIIISETAIYSPVFQEADVVLVLNQPSYDRFMNQVGKGGLLLYNSSLIESVKSSPHYRVVGIPINDIATEMGNPKIANMVLLGAYLATSPLFTMQEMQSVLKHYLKDGKEKLYDINVLALEKGYQYMKELGPC